MSTSGYIHGDPQVCRKPPCVAPRKCWQFTYCWFYGNPPKEKHVLKFDDGKHCHWTYRTGLYHSFLRWPTREAIEEDMKDEIVSGWAEIYIHHNCGADESAKECVK